MFSVTGAPGVGKTATASLLTDKLDGFVVAEMDLFTQPELDTSSTRMMTFRRGGSSLEPPWRRAEAT